MGRRREGGVRAAIYIVGLLWLSSHRPTLPPHLVPPHLVTTETTAFLDMVCHEAPAHQVEIGDPFLA